MRAVPYIRLTLAAVLAVALASGFVCEAPVFAKAFFPKKAKSALKRIAQVRKKCAAKFPFKTDFVTLNGGFVRAIGQHLCNGVILMEPGDMLVDPNVKRTDMTKPADRMVELSAYCATNGARFLYVQLPKRLDVAGTMLPPGEVDLANDNANEFNAKILTRKVDVLDLRPRLVATADDVLANFFRTDHHWKIDTAFRVAGELVSEIPSRCAVGTAAASDAYELLRPANWSREVVPGMFLGSLGRRTGHLYAAKDDLVILRPKFKTEMTMSIPEKNWRRSGTFEDTVMWRLDDVRRGMREDAFSIDAYTSLYVGGLYAHVRHENRNAPIGKKILLVGDSFSRPVEGFLSIAFRRLDFIDLRRCGRGFSLADYLRREHPDIVVQMLTPNSLTAHSMVGVKTALPIMFEYGLHP